ncbi:MAG: pilus assembly protein [Firmicutes bacterium]|nr:pilus assembly protein [Bacillota bacterium]MCL5038828.1 pilus assembly protein [Bacillota bacterium]
MDAFGRWKKGSGGQSTVELALLLPVILFILFGIAEFGRAFNAYITLENAAREGARLGVTGASDAEILDRVKAVAVTLDEARLTVQITPAEGARQRGETITVHTTYDFPLVVPLIGQILQGQPLILEAALSMRLE